MAKGIRMNGDHGKIYARIDERYDTLGDKIDKIKEDVSTIRTHTAVMKKSLENLPCNTNSKKINLIESRINMGIGGLAAFDFLLIILTITKLLGAW